MLLQLQNILTQRRVVGHSSNAHKTLLLSLLHAAGSLEFTGAVLQALHAEIEREIAAVDAAVAGAASAAGAAAEEENVEIRALVEALKV
jgi:hypothetical protein